MRQDAQLKDVNLAMLTECARNKLWEIDDYFLEKSHQLVINQFNQDRYAQHLICSILLFTSLYLYVFGL